VSWAATLRQHARLHTPAALGLRLALLGGAASFALMMVLDTTLG